MKRLRLAGALIALCLITVVSLSTAFLAQSKKQLDINTATEEEFVALGIEKAAAKKIVEARPFRAKNELVSKQLLTKAQYDKLKDSIVAKRPTETAAPKLKPATTPAGNPVSGTPAGTSVGKPVGK